MSSRYGLFRRMKAETLCRNREQRTIYEVHRYRDDGAKSLTRAPAIEEFMGLDRARLAALAYALDGPVSMADPFTGRVEVHRVLYVGGRRINTALIDVLDERVAFRVLNELVLPHADDLSVPIERLQAETNRLARLGF